ncbi:MAG: flagellar basal body protein [Mucispirillum sp.]|nr:flagellar basal body protein [Mucispirillum sp.]
MINAMFGAVTALNAAVAVSAVTANNIANVKTSGYKSNSAFLSELSTGGVKLSAIRPNNNQGSLIPTDVPSDIAVFGNGSEEDLLNTYSYAGKFAVDDFGNFRGPSGELLFTGAGGNVRLDNEGNLYSDGKLLGTITPAGAEGQEYEPTGFSILTGYMVSSNVDIADEIVNNMVNQRFFEANAVTIRTSDEMLGTVINLKA